MKSIYERVRSQGTAFVRVSHLNPCPLCGKPDWCSTTENGVGVICMRQIVCTDACSPLCRYSTRQTANGGYWHLLGDGHAPQTHVEGQQRPLRVPQVLASLSSRHDAYSAILEAFPPSQTHAWHLRYIRGIPPNVIPFFGSLTDDDDIRQEVVTTLEQRGVDLHGIPGFFFDQGWRILKVGVGILIPSIDQQGSIQALQVRRDTTEHDKRYIWLSTGSLPGGTRVPPAFSLWNPDAYVRTKRIWITEGPLKAASAAFGMDEAVIGVPAIQNWHDLFRVLPKNKETHVYIAYDQDDNPFVNAARDELAAEVASWGYTVFIVHWNAEVKGLDDAVLLAQREPGWYRVSRV